MIVKGGVGYDSFSHVGYHVGDYLHYLVGVLRKKSNF